MNRLAVGIITLLAGVTSCVPMVTTSKMGHHLDIQNKFNEESERVLVLPVWETYPLLAAEGQQTIRTFGEPLFLTVSQLPYLEKRIPARTSVSLMGIASAFGRLITIDRVVIISETGKIVTLCCSGGGREERCEEAYDNCLNPAWRDDLAQTFKEADGKTTYSDPSVSRLIRCYAADRTDTDVNNVLFKITNTRNEKDSIILFMSGITNFCTSNYNDF